MESQKNPNNKNNLEKEKVSLILPDLKHLTKLQKPKQYGTGIKTRYRPMEHIREAKNKLTYMVK